MSPLSRGEDMRHSPIFEEDSVSGLVFEYNCAMFFPFVLVGEFRSRPFGVLS